MSIFTMEDVNHVITKSLDEAKAYALSVIERAENVKPLTVTKARHMVCRCRNSNALAVAMSSWILAHPSEGLKVVKVFAAGTA